MDNPTTTRGDQESAVQQTGGFSAGLQIIDRTLNWLVGFIRLTEEEQKDAGIYLHDQRYK